MTSDARRTFLVLGDRVDLFAALKPRLESELLQVWWVGSDDPDVAAARCAPWPWGIAGVGGATDLGSLASKPVLWFWLHSSTSTLPSQARQHEHWRTLAEDVVACVNRQVAEVRLAPNRGLISPGGSLVLCPALEGLVGNSPSPLPTSSGVRRSASRAIVRHGLPLRLTTDAGMTRVEGSL